MLKVSTGEVAGSATASALPSIESRYVKLKAEYDNSGRVYIGLSTVTKADGTTSVTAGWQLSAGEETPWLPVTNLSQLYRICDNAGDDLTYTVLS